MKFRAFLFETVKRGNNETEKVENFDSLFPRFPVSFFLFSQILLLETKRQQCIDAINYHDG